MLKLTRLDHHTIAINPDHIAWVEATPDTMLCLVGDRKIIVRESLDEVVERFIEVQKQIGRPTAAALHVAPPSDAAGEH
jgi:flagellar protein FlbD